MAADNLKKVKILVLGDTGVGKTSLTHFLCYGEVRGSPSWTIGCTVEVKIHDYGRSLSKSTSYYVELWDVGGSPAHQQGRAVFYQQVNGIILVHDLTNRKSHANLTKWLSEFYRSQAREQQPGRKASRALPSFDSPSDLEFDPESFAEQNLPLLVVGTHMDQVPPSKSPPASTLPGAMCINIDSTNPRQFAIGSPQTIQFNKFFDKVIERRFYSSLHTAGPQSGERIRTISKRMPVTSQ